MMVEGKFRIVVCFRGFKKRNEILLIYLCGNFKAKEVEDNKKTNKRS